MIEFRFLKQSDATRLTGKPFEQAANPDWLVESLSEQPVSAARVVDVGPRTDRSNQPPTESQVRSQLAASQREHHQLDWQLDQLLQSPPVDEIQIRRLKKHKLLLKDRIVALQMLLVPDIPA